MTPQEMAVHLYKRFTFPIQDRLSNDPHFDDIFYVAKVCCKVAVQEIRAELERERVFEKDSYWQDVDAEIEKL